MCGGSPDQKRIISQDEIKYLDALVRGVYAKRDLPTGYTIDSRTFAEDFRLAVPLLKGQISTREVLNGIKTIKPITANRPVTIDDIDGPYATIQDLRNQIIERGYGA